MTDFTDVKLNCITDLDSLTASTKNRQVDADRWGGVVHYTNRCKHMALAGLVAVIGGILLGSCGIPSNAVDDEKSTPSSSAAPQSTNPSTRRLPSERLEWVPFGGSQTCDNCPISGRFVCARPNQEAATHAYEGLPEVTFYSRNSKLNVRGRLYSEQGAIDERMAKRLDTLLADVRDPKQPKQLPIDRRLLQLLFLGAYHFGVDRIEVVSAYREQRRKREGLHAWGRAIDFAMPDVKLETLASYFRSLARVGVGIYTHRRTRFVHLDVREHSYHWLDASPPGRTWRGMSIGNTTIIRRDAAYQACDDWPEPLRPLLAVPTLTPLELRIGSEPSATLNWPKLAGESPSNDEGSARPDESMNEW